jgi:hypothetical protein
MTLHDKAKDSSLPISSPSYLAPLFFTWLGDPIYGDPLSMKTRLMILKMHPVQMVLASIIDCFLLKTGLQKSTLGRIRTYDRPLRRRMLYPAELRVLIYTLYYICLPRAIFCSQIIVIWPSSS